MLEGSAGVEGRREFLLSFGEFCVPGYSDNRRIHQGVGGAICLGVVVNGHWSVSWDKLHISVLWPLTVLLAVQHVSPMLSGQHALIRLDNTSLVCLHQQTRRDQSFRPLSQVANCLLSEMERKSILSLRAVHVPGHYQCRYGSALMGTHGGGLAPSPPGGEGDLVLLWRGRCWTVCNTSEDTVPYGSPWGEDKPPLGVDALAQHNPGPRVSYRLLPRLHCFPRTWPSRGGRII